MRKESTFLAKLDQNYCLSRLGKIFHAERDSGTFKLKLFGFPIIDYTPDILMSLTTSAEDNIPAPAECSGVQLITRDNVGEFAAYRPSEFFLSQKQALCECFGVWKNPGTPAGYLRVLYKGSAIGRYRVRNIDAFIVNVFVNAEFRRKGYGEYLLRETLRYLHTSKHIHTAYLIVHVNNFPARRLYAKAGGVDLRAIKHLRLFNVPIVLRLQKL